MTVDEFIDQLDTFCRSTIGDKWQFNYELQEDDGLEFKSFVAWGFEEPCYNDDRCECPRCWKENENANISD